MVLCYVCDIDIDILVCIHVHIVFCIPVHVHVHAINSDSISSITGRCNGCQVKYPSQHDVTLTHVVLPR